MPNDNFTLYLESTALSAPYQFNATEMTPVGGDENYSTFHVELEADNVTSSEDQEYWIIAEQAGFDYTNKFGTSNLADTDPLAGFFRYDLEVNSGSGNTPPTIEGITDDIDPDGLNTKVSDDNTAVTYILLYTDPDTGQTHTIDWYIEDTGTGMPTDPPDAMPFDWSLKPEGDYEIWVKIDDGYGAVTGGPWAVTKVPPGPTGWARTWGGAFQERCYETAIDSDNNIYACGYFYYNIDFDPGTGVDMHDSGGNRNSFLVKYDPQGNYIWGRTWCYDEPSFGGMAVAMDVGPNDNIVVSGHFFGVNMDFDPGPGEDLQSEIATGGSCYITLFDKNGNHLWSRVWGGDDPTFANSANGVCFDSTGAVIASGSFIKNCDFDPGPGEYFVYSQNGKWDTFVTKFDSSGNWKWAHTWGGPYEDLSTGCHVDQNDDVYVTGWFGYTSDFDDSPNEDIHDATTEGNDYLVKFSSGGLYQWGKAFGRGYTHQIRHDSSNRIYVVGEFGGTAQFDTTGGTASKTSVGASDGFVTVYQPDGTWLKVITWDMIHAGDSSSGGNGMDIDVNDNVYLVGQFTQTADVDPADGGHILTSAGEQDVFVMMLDSSLNYVWASSFGGPGLEEGVGVAGDPYGRAYPVGCYQTDCDFDPGPDVDIHPCYGVINSYLCRINPGGYW